MTVAQMLTELDLRMDEANAPWFNDAEKLRFLNSAQQTLVRQYLDIFDVNDRARQALANLNERPALTFTQVGTTPEWTANLDSVVLPNNGVPVHVSAVLVTLSLGLKTNYRTVCNYVRDHMLEGILRNPHTRPSIDKPLYTMQHDGSTNTVRQISVWVDSPNRPAPYATIANTAQVNVLRLPREMNTVGPVECELFPWLHQELITIAVTRMLETVESARTGTQHQVQAE